MVSNIGQAADGSHIFAGSRAQSFTTGSNADGYTLTGVDIVVTNTGDFAAKVCETDSSGYPTSTCTDLTAPGTIDVGTLSFTAPADTTLVKETTYAVVATANAISSLGRTASDAEDTGHEADWRIADAYDQFNTSSNLWSTTTTDKSLRFAIKGYAAGGDTPPACTLNTGDLWCGVMTVGEFSLGPTGGTGRGYRFGQTGSLTDDEFPFDGDTPYRVQAVYYVSAASSTSLPAGTLALTIDLGIPDGLTLQLGNEQFPTSNASSQSGTSIFWSGSGLNWSVGDDVTLRLRGEVPPTVTVADATATEGDAVEFVVTLSAVSGHDVMVDYAMSETDPQSAASGTDFTSTGGTLTIAAADNTATGTIEVPTTEDDASSSAETFTLTLSNPTNATLGTPSAATGTINDNDGTLSPDATLSGLSLGTGVTLSPTFASGTNTYTSSVANSVDEVTVTPTTNHASATVEILDTDDNELDDAEDDFQVALSVGDTVIKVKVTAEDGTSTQTYTVTVTRAAEMTPDDFPADTTTTGQVDVGGSVTGTIEIGDDQDWFAVDLEGGKRYQIDLEGVPTGRGTLADPVLQAIRDSSSIVVSLDTYNDDSGVGVNARFTYTLSVIVLGANGASEADTDFPATTGRVEVGGSATGNIENSNDDDWFRVDLEAGKTYQFDLEGVDTSRGMLDDPYLGLFDGSGTYLFDDDDDGTGLNSRITHTPATGGTYYLRATRAGYSAGTYTLSVRDITPATCTLNTGDVWCGVVTVETITFSGTSYLGYLDGTGGGGMLSDNDFEFTDTDLDSASHTITAVLLDSGTLNLVFDNVQQEDEKPVLNTWDLQVGTDTFALDGANVTQLPTGGYQLTGTGLSWSVGDTVTLRLRGETVPPSVANVAVTSMPLLTSSGGSEQDTCGAGDEIEFTVTFSPTVVVTGDPQFGFSLSGARQADYRSGSGSTALKFVYTVQSSDSDDDGIWIGNHNSGTKSLQLDSNDEITSPGGIDANLEHDQLQVQAGHKVDGSRSSKPTLSVADAAATEGSNVSFTVTLSAAAVTASIESGDTAVAADLGSTKTGPVEIAAGDTDATITVATVEDTTVEVNETFTVTLSGVSSNAQLSPTAATAQGTINNDDLATASVADVSAAEGTADDEGLTFTVTLSKPVSPQLVIVGWIASIESGDSAAEADLTGDKAGTVSIAKGSTTAMFTVETADTTDEENQTFTVTLSTPIPPTLVELAADPTARGTIEDDDDPPALTVVDMTVIEGDQDPDDVVSSPGFPFTVTLSAASEKRVRFKFRRVLDGTATDADMRAAVEFLGNFYVIRAGGTSNLQSINSIVNDALDEDDETFTIEIHAFENATAGTKTRSTITIEDDDPTPTVTDAAATEGDDVEFVVTLSAVSGRDVDVDYATSVATGGDATSGTYFTAASGTLTIAAADNTATGTIEVQTTQDDASGSAETFTLTISSPDNATLTTDTTATGTINNRATTATEPTGFEAEVGDAEVELSWDAPASDSGVTRHEYQFKTGTGAYQGWVQIANSGVGGTNEAGFTVTSLTNEVLHTFQLRAVNAQGESTAAEADALTPTPGICDRTAKIQEVILDELADVSECAAVTVADLASITTFGGSLGLATVNQGITSLDAGDFAGLTALPEGTFAGLTTLAGIDLAATRLTAIPARTFEDRTALVGLDLSGNDLSSLDAGVFSGLASLRALSLNENDLVSLPAGLFSGLTALATLNLASNDLTALPDGLFSGLTALTSLKLGDNPNTGDTMSLTVTVEKVGTDQARAKVLAGAPAAVEFTPTVVNGSLPTGVTKLAVAAGEVNGTAVTVTRTTGTMAAVTVDIDLSTQPSLASGFTGFEFAKATSGLPATILPDTRGPQNFTAAPGDGQAVLSWDAPASGSGVTKHQYRQKEGTGSYGTWTDIPNSAEGGANEDGYTVPDLTNETAYTFELKRFVGTTESATAESNTVTPTPGICDRTQEVQDGILAAVAGVDECAAVTVANLAGIGDLDVINTGITSVQLGDFAGLTGLQELSLTENSSLTALPSGVFSGVTSRQVV